MRVEIAADALADEQSWSVLDRIVDALYDEEHQDERHLWEIDDIEALLASSWLQPPNHRRSRATREVAERSFQAAVKVSQARRMHTERVVVTAAPPTTGRFCLAPRRALEVLQAPFRVVVENKRSDGTFIETMALVFGHRDLLRAIARGWCDFVHAGGSGELLKRVEECLAAGALPGRVAVITDGDRLSPKAAVDQRAEALRRECSGRGVSCFILHKRDSENYLPVEVLALALHGEKLTVFIRLSQEQRDHFDMKEGFSNRWPADAPAYLALFDDLNERRRSVLAGGFGKDVGELFESKREYFRREDVEKTCATAPGELQALLDELESRL